MIKKPFRFAMPTPANHIAQRDYSVKAQPKPISLPRGTFIYVAPPSRLEKKECEMQHANKNYLDLGYEKASLSETVHNCVKKGCTHDCERHGTSCLTQYAEIKNQEINALLYYLRCQREYTALKNE